VPWHGLVGGGGGGSLGVPGWPPVVPRAGPPPPGLAERAAGAALARPLVHLAAVPSSALAAATSSNTGAALARLASPVAACGPAAALGGPNWLPRHGAALQHPGTTTQRPRGEWEFGPPWFETHLSRGVTPPPARGGFGNLFRRLVHFWPIGYLFPPATWGFWLV
jgi:hypothetical protein